MSSNSSTPKKGRWLGYNESRPLGMVTAIITGRWGGMSSFISSALQQVLPNILEEKDAKFVVRNEIVDYCYRVGRSNIAQGWSRIQNSIRFALSQIG